MPNLKYNPTGTQYLQNILGVAIRNAYRNKLNEILTKIENNKVSIEKFIAVEANLPPASIALILASLNNVSENLKPIVYMVLNKAWGKSEKDLASKNIKPLGVNLGTKTHIQNNAFMFVKGLAIEERERLKDVLETSISQGDSISVIKREVRNSFSNVAWRSEVIARTEVVRAYNVGSLESMRAAGIKHYEWIAAIDERTRPTHAARNGKIFSVERALKKLDPIPTEVYINGKWLGEENCNCRCSISAVID